MPFILGLPSLSKLTPAVNSLRFGGIHIEYAFVYNSLKNLFDSSRTPKLNTISTEERT